MSANDTQVAGQHYRSPIQHWDYVVANDLDYFQAQITKYVTRWKKKNGITDLTKAKHFLDKYMEVIAADPEYGRPHKVGKAALSDGGASTLPPPTIPLISPPNEPTADQPTASQLHPA